MSDGFEEDDQDEDDIDEPEMFSQVGLVSAILTYLGKCEGMQLVSNRVVNTIIKAADLIVKQVQRPDVMATPGMGPAAWRRSDDTGVSSCYLADILENGISDEQHRFPNPYPHDPGDFGRCVRMLEAAPELREYLHRMLDPEHGPEWNAIAAAWDELEALYREEMPSGTAPRLYARLQELRGIKQCAPQTRTSTSSPES